ncbi:oxidoreductase domain protein [Mycobacterium xenopi 4042]|uniref:Oxidoreductase domain protein n=1 Tax=Mycobacterium xenopi 4042 TaxID=1299334 RepID=X8EDN5_MYCXE|nr:oxidoreductase domain protein [Mycobacterium xenopi 4042]
MTDDPLAPLLELHGVAAACEQVRDALGRAHRHRANLRDWPVTAAEAALRRRGLGRARRRRAQPGRPRGQ